MLRPLSVAGPHPRGKFTYPMIPRRADVTFLLRTEICAVVLTVDATKIVQQVPNLY